jgi:hypothetical protein
MPFYIKYVGLHGQSLWGVRNINQNSNLKHNKKKEDFKYMTLHYKHIRRQRMKTGKDQDEVEIEEHQTPNNQAVTSHHFRWKSAAFIFFSNTCFCER